MSRFEASVLDQVPVEYVRLNVLLSDLLQGLTSSTEDIPPEPSTPYWNYPTKIVLFAYRDMYIDKASLLNPFLLPNALRPLTLRMWRETEVISCWDQSFPNANKVIYEKEITVEDGKFFFDDDIGITDRFIPQGTYLHFGFFPVLGDETGDLVPGDEVGSSSSSDALGWQEELNEVALAVDGGSSSSSEDVDLPLWPLPEPPLQLPAFLWDGGGKWTLDLRLRVFNRP